MRRTPMLALAALALVAAACGSGATSDVEAGAPAETTLVFPPADADALARAALPGADDMAGPGWVVISTNGNWNGPDASEDWADFDAVLASDPACARFTDLATMGSLFGEVGDDRQPAGWASVELENAFYEGFFPLSLEMDISIMADAAEVDRAWASVQDLTSRGGFQTCLARVFAAAFTYDPETELPTDLRVEVSEGRPSTEPPHGGVAMAFDLSMVFAGVESDMVMEMYLWPHGNAEVSVLVIGSPEALATGVSGDALAVLDAKVTAAAASA